MSHMLLIWLLILVGPFVAVAPPTLAAALQLDPYDARVRRWRFRVRRAFRVRLSRMAVAW